MSILNGDEIIDEVIRLTASLRADTTKYMEMVEENFNVTISKINAGDEARYKYVDAVKNDLEEKFKRYTEVIQASLIEHDLKNARNVVDMINSNRLIAASQIYASKDWSTRESSIADVFLIEKLIAERSGEKS